jgi:hypothetical protein
MADKHLVYDTGRAPAELKDALTKDGKDMKSEAKSHNCPHKFRHNGAGRL